MFRAENFLQRLFSVHCQLFFRSISTIPVGKPYKARSNRMRKCTKTKKSANANVQNWNVFSCYSKLISGRLTWAGPCNPCFCTMHTCNLNGVAKTRWPSDIRFTVWIKMKNKNAYLRCGLQACVLIQFRLCKWIHKSSEAAIKSPLRWGNWNAL